ncbi:MAG: hypothetical protein ACD_75C02495G0001, partial [uncultured bacterium]
MKPSLGLGIVAQVIVVRGKIPKVPMVGHLTDVAPEGEAGSEGGFVVQIKGPAVPI